MGIYKSISELVGNTPLVQINKSNNTKANIFAKVEYFNPTGSVKDRIAKSMIENAEQKGLINKDTLIIEPTSGNTGIGLAAIATSKGYKAVIVMPDTMSVERRNLMKAYGAKVVLSDGTKGMKGAIEKANELKEENPNAFIPGQFNNPSNPLAHYKTTGPEIYNDLEGKVDVLVGGIGTGGTISGTAEGLKRHNPNIKAIGVEPQRSPLLSGGKAGPHKIQGIGANFIPKNYHPEVVDKIISISDEDAMNAARLLAQKEGLLVGISSGAAFYAALQLARMEENTGKMIVVLLPDTGERYLSTELFR